MNERRMSRFWATGGVFTLPGWYHKGYAFAPKPEPVAEPLPTPAELEAFAQLPLDARRAIEESGFGFPVSIADSGDRKRERAPRKRAA